MVISTLPLQEVDFSVFLRSDLSEINEDLPWPPSGFQKRDARLTTYHDLWRGDFSAFIEEREDQVLSINRFRRVCEDMSNILLSTTPISKSGLDLSDPARDLVTDMTRYGLGVLQVVSEEQIDTIDPRMIYPVEDGSVIQASRYASTDSEIREVDRVEFTHLIDGEHPEVSVYRYANGLIGSFIESYEYPFESQVILAAKYPSTGLWGMSMFEDLLSPVLGLSRRLSSNQDILNKHQRPLLNYFRDRDAALNAFIEDPNLTEEQTELELTRQLEIYRQANIRVVSDSEVKMEYVTWDANLDGSIEQIERIKQELNGITKMENLVDQLNGATSGVALKKLLLPLYFRIQSFQREILNYLEQAIDEAVDWPHPFDETDESPIADPQELVV